MTDASAESSYRRAEREVRRELTGDGDSDSPGPSGDGPRIQLGRTPDGPILVDLEEFIEDLRRNGGSP